MGLEAILSYLFMWFGGELEGLTTEPSTSDRSEQGDLDENFLECQ